MAKFRNLVFFLTFIFLSERSFAQSRELGSECTSLRKPAIHITRPGDQVGQVLYDLGLGPLWGKGRLVEKTLKLNRMKSDRDLIYRRNLVLPLECIEDLEKFEVKESSQYDIVLRLKPDLPLLPKSPPLSTKPTAVISVESPSKTEWWTTFQAQIVYRQIQGRDRGDGTSGQLSSNADPALTVGIHAKPSANWDYSGELSLENLSIIPSDQGVPVRGTPLVLMGGGAHATYHASPLFFVKGGFQYEEHPTYKAALGSGIELKAQTFINPLVGFGTEKKIYSTSLSSQLYAYLSEYSGWGLDLKVKPQQKNNLFCSVLFESRTLQTQLLQQEDKKMSLGCGWEFR